MSARFHPTFTPDGVRIGVIEERRFGRSREVVRSDWAAAGLDRKALLEIEALVESGIARSTEGEVWLPLAHACSLPAGIADAIGVPPPTALALSVALDGRIEAPAGLLRLRWTDRWGREVRPVRKGLLLEWGGQGGRLTPSLLRLVEAVDSYNQTNGQDVEQRISAWLPVQETLKQLTGAEVHRDGFLETFTLYQAGAFALDVRETAHGIDFAPILMSRNKAYSAEDDGPPDDAGEVSGSISSPGGFEGAGAWSEALLSAEDQRTFVAQAVDKPGATRDAYQIGRNRYVLINPALKATLDVVKEKRKAPAEERRAFLRNPRATIARTMDTFGDDVAPGELFVETQHYSDRVEGLGLWERPKLPWLTRRPNAWLPESGWVVDGPGAELAPLTPDEITQIEKDIEAAEIRGDAHVVIRGHPIPVDFAPKVLAEERQRSEAAEEPDNGSSESESTGENSAPKERLVLIIRKTNFDGVEYQLGLRPRTAQISPDTPPIERIGSTPFKPHQLDGFRWLVQAWMAGWPGVLLADDMGLGKTYQALAFLAWLKSNAALCRQQGNAQGAAQGPCLIVAPTALLRNWEKECTDRLSGPGLGRRVEAYGSALRRLKLPQSSDDDGDTLDVAELRDADWILTTYETLTDHERSFARIPYSVVIFDEMQKIKAPDTLNTKAAKALHADFVVGLTGTPIENRMEDLWCLFDRLVPGYLGDLKNFSKAFKQETPERLTELKRSLDSPEQGAPPLMKRRMKVDILEGLPTKEENKYPVPMSPEQAQAYRELIQEVRRTTDRTSGFMLKALHGMRGISLHPRDPSSVDGTNADQFETFVRQSARLSTTVGLLNEIAKRREKALLFIESLAMQDVLASGLAGLFNMDRKPAIINGSTPGERRLAVVEAFEKSTGGFHVLILAPKAAGIGLNIVSANHVIHLSRWWNPAVEDQCNDRVYRIGQTKPVMIHIPISIHPDFPGESFDEVLDRLLEAKRRLSRDMLAPPTSESDLENLFGNTVRN